MKKTLLFTIALVFVALCSSSLKAQDVFNLGVNDSIITHLRGYQGTNIVLVIPQGYTNPINSSTGTPSSIDLSKLSNLTSSTKITIKGDGTMPTVISKLIVLPAALSKIAFQGLTLTGTTTDATTNYIFNQVSTLPCVVDSILFDNCDISTFNAAIRFQNANTIAVGATQFVNHVNINNCVVHNFPQYGFTYNSATGGFFGPVKVTKSTFYGFGASIFMLQKNATSVDITDCTFDNVVNVTAGKAIVDFGVVPHPTTLTNCIFGKAISGANSIITGGITGTLAIANTYTTTDWLANVPEATSSLALPSSALTGAFIPYSGASTDLFTTVSVSSGALATYATTIGNYKIKDAAFAGANSAGDPRGYLNPAQGISSVLSDKGISFNGSEIVNTKGMAIEVYSVLGKKVASSMTSISTTNFQKGIYIVRAIGISESLKICI